MTIRKATAGDFHYIRRLPVSLTAQVVATLQHKEWRMMMQVPDIELMVLTNEQRILGFAALQFVPSVDSAIRFLVIRCLAAGRFGFRHNAPAQLEQHACAFAKANGCTAILVRAGSLKNPVITFYREHGYRMEGEALIKADFCAPGD